MAAASTASLVSKLQVSAGEEIQRLSREQGQRMAAASTASLVSKLQVSAGGMAKRFAQEQAQKWADLSSSVNIVRILEEQARYLNPVVAQLTNTAGNWQGMGEVRLKSLLDLARLGLGVVWVPRAQLLTYLVQEPQRTDILLVESSDDLLDDCARALLPVRHGLAEFLMACIDSARQGHFWPAQALAANVIDTTCRQMMDPNLKFKYSDLHKAVGEQPINSDLRWGAALAPIAGDLFDYHDFRETVPETVNRHATAHVVSESQYSVQNCLRLLLIATSLLREIHERCFDDSHQLFNPPA